MNIIYFHTHDSGRFLDPANSPRSLPNLERFSAAAVTFRNAFSAAPTCSPSRSALLTGQYPHENGMVGLAHRGFHLHQDAQHIAGSLSRVGMETVLCGVQHVAGDKSELGYERVLDARQDYFSRKDVVPHEWDMDNASRVAQFVGEPHDRPFFLSYGLLSTHRPFPQPPAERSQRMYAPPPWEVPDTPNTRADMEGFLTSLQVVDRALGVVLDAVIEAGLWESTAIVVTTDHGPPFPEMKNTLRDAGFGVSLIMRIPGLADDGSVEHSLVSQIDLYPTLRELAETREVTGAAPEKPKSATDAEEASGATSAADTARWDHESIGRSLLPLLHGDYGSARTAVYGETNYHAVYEPARTVRTNRYKLTRRYGTESTPLPANVDDSPGKDVMRKAGYFRIPRAREKLVDLGLDPGECRNFVWDPSYAEIYKQLARRLDTWMQHSRDPLFTGPMPRPAGSVLNKRDASSAEEPTYEAEHDTHE